MTDDKEPFSLFIPCNPVAQPRPRAVVVHGRPMMYGAPKTHPIHAFRSLVKSSVQKAWKCPAIDGAVGVTAVFMLPRPRSVGRSQRPMPTVKPDFDNLVKGLVDALRGVCWRDDSQIVSARIDKYYADDEDPGVWIRVEERVDSRTWYEIMSTPA